MKPGLGPSDLTTLLTGPQVHLDIDGWCHGPLFAPVAKKRERIRMSGGAAVWIKYRRARPIWAKPADITAFWRASERMTAETGVQHSVDHIVPLIHPLVCGLHCPDNLEVTTLAANIRKSNSYWPDMWSPQGDLF